MLLLVELRLNDKDLQKVASDLDGYIKFVVDVDLGILTAGGPRHFEGEKMLLDNGSRQGNLWGGGLDLESGEVDFDSMINIRPNDNNPSREILSQEMRSKVESIVRKLLR